jgi:phosphatidylserine/phosphatidylglycerophosphate/cardiolipin synthase-like enzyme
LKPQQIKDILKQTLDDRRLSRSERSALDQILDHLDPSQQTVAVYRSVAFDLARECLADPQSKAVVEWLEDVLKLLRKQSSSTPQSSLAEAHFSPGDDGPRRIAGLLRGARKTVDICVFTITDDRISSAVLDAHRRGCKLRIITDDDKASDLGSDIDRLEAAGVPVRVDRTHYHMHHKFALFDGARLLTGSYNWTRSAAANNEENFIVTDDRRLVEPFAELFEKLWRTFE